MSRQTGQTGIFITNVVTRRVRLGITELGANVSALLRSKFAEESEGRCIAEGYVRPGSTTIVAHSAGELAGESIMFTASFECEICRPVEGMNIRGCTVRNVTKAGARATLGGQSHIVIFIARDHAAGDEDFAKLAVGDVVTTRVVGVRYELGDAQVSVVATLEQRA